MKRGEKREANLASLISFHFTGKLKYQSSNIFDGKHLSIVLVFLKSETHNIISNLISNYI